MRAILWVLLKHNGSGYRRRGIKVHPVAQANLAILGVESAQELAGIIAASGLAQNLGALRALSTKGIQAGHMKLHARNMAVSAGAIGEEIEIVAARLQQEKGPKNPNSRRRTSQIVTRRVISLFFAQWRE